MTGVHLLIDLHTELDFPGNPQLHNSLYVAFAEKSTFMSLDSVIIPSGHSAKVGLQKSVFKRKHNNIFSSCAEDMERQIVTYPYSYLTCQQECIGRKALEICGCIQLIPNEFRANMSIPICANYQDACGVADVFKENDCLEKCLPTCQVHKFGFHVGTGRFPSKGMILDSVQTGTTKFLNRSDDLIMLEISYTSLEVRTLYVS